MSRISKAELASLSPGELAHLATVLEKIDQDRAAGRVSWLCSRKDCDGSPHPGYPGPHARPNQRPPGGDWTTWMLLAGRGFGKTRTGAEWAWRMAKKYPGSRGALIGPTAGDTRATLVEGESGIMACAPATFRPVYEPSKRLVTYPNGSTQTLFSADEPDRLRGPQHHYAWADELAAWRKLQYCWDMLKMGMRLGDLPRVVVTTTPRPLPLVKELLKNPKSAITRGTTYDNLANLAPTFREDVVSRYEGTTLGRQELDAEILDDLPGALLSRAVIDRGRVESGPAALLRVVAMDPAGTGRGDETGLIAGYRGNDGHDYVTHDVSEKLTPDQAARRAWALVKDTESDILVFEDNFGKGWVKEVLAKTYEDMGLGRKEDAPLAEVWASAGKQLRAQPVVMRYEQNKVHHVGDLPELEDQYTTWIPEEEPTKSPDRVDAAVHLVTFLMKRFDTGALVLPRRPGMPPTRTPQPVGRTS